MTNKTWTESVNSNAGDPNNWSPAGVPVPGDTLTMLYAERNHEHPR
jgi:hypothetical protein